jgi:hypothetical protein
MFLEIAARDFEQAPFHLHLNIGINGAMRTAEWPTRRINGAL